ncbi:MAG: DNA-binding protein, partial [Actinomycetota bacterium]|nr:DNA-binding protein [Actinomycetota bacterium]
MIQLGDGADDTRRQVERARLVAESSDSAGVENVLNALIDARLVTTDDKTVAIVHEILLRAWPRLRQWINADREGLLLEQRLDEAAKAWDRDGRHDSDLYRGHRLAALRERLDAADPRLPALTSAFLHASVTRERAEELGVLRRGRMRKLIAVLSSL